MHSIHRRVAINYEIFWSFVHGDNMDTSIRISKEIHEKLEALKFMRGCKSFTDLFEDVLPYLQNRFSPVAEPEHPQGGVLKREKKLAPVILLCAV